MPEREPRLNLIDKKYLEEPIFENEFEHLAGRIYLKEREKTEESLSALRGRLIQAGFEEEEVEKHIKYNYMLGTDDDYGKNFTDETLTLLATSEMGASTRVKFFGLMLTNQEPMAKSILAQSLNTLSLRNDEELVEIRKNIKLSTDSFEDELGTFSQKAFLIKFAAVSQTIADKDGLFKLFGNDLEKAIEYIKVHGDNLWNTSLLEGFTYLRNIQNRDVLFEGLDAHKIEILINPLTDLMSKKRGSSLAYNQYLRSPKGWKDKIRLFKPVLGAVNIWYEPGIEEDEAVMEQIRRREDENGVLVSLFGMKCGWEIEYDGDTEVNKKASKTNLTTYLQKIGFKPGSGGLSSGEASPGPFFDPKTAIVVFEQYVDANIIDLKAFYGFTNHFNISNRPYLDANDLVPIARGQELTGTAVNHHDDSESNVLFINERGDDRIEGKIYAVHTRDQFEYNFNSSTQLALAMTMAKEREAGISGPGEVWRLALGDLYTEYHERLSAGLAYFGREDYLDDAINWTNELDGKVIKPNEAWVRGQLRRIFRDKTYKKHVDPLTVGPASKGERNIRGIEGLEVNGVWYRNIVQYSREVTDDIVGKIEAIKNGIEQEAIQDILSIESQTQEKEKEDMIAVFVQKYNVRCLDPDSPAYRETAYKHVRAVYFPEEDKEKDSN